MFRQATATDGVRRSIRNHWTKLEARYQIVFACFLATFTAYVERVGFSIAFTAMAKDAGVGEATKGTVLSAFFWGYAVSQVPGGWAAQKWGGQRTLGISFALWSTASLLTPKDAQRTGTVMAARVCVGVAQGFIIPSIHTVLSQWIPPHERARAVSLTTSGMYLGSAGAMLFLPALSRALGPSSLLRAVGILGLLWLLLWTLVGREVPHRLSVMPLSTGEDHKGARTKGRPPATPWLRMMTHSAVWAIIINNFTFHYAFYVVMNWLPTYFDKVLGSELSDLGSLRTAPYLMMFASSNFGGWLGDALVVRQQYSVVSARRVVNSIGFWGASTALLCMPLPHSKYVGLLVVTWLLGILGFSRGGFSVNHMDIAPKYAGPLMGISNTAGTLAGVIGVAATGWLIERGHGLAGWWQAFAVSAVLCTGGSVLFLMFAAGERIFSDSDPY